MVKLKLLTELRSKIILSLANICQDSNDHELNEYFRDLVMILDKMVSYYEKKGKNNGTDTI